MGIIKTAILTGGGIYAVKKLAKAAEHRQSSPSKSQGTRNQEYNSDQQGYWGLPGPPPMQWEQYSGQQQWYPANLSQPQQAQRGSFPIYNPMDYEQREAGYQHQPRDGPPSYYQQQQPQERPPQNPTSARGSLEGLAGLALQLASKSGGAGGKGSKRGIEGQKSVGEFFGR